MKYESILIVTYGRTGSTLLQGLLNIIPGTVVRGENANFAFGLYRSYLSLKQVIDEHAEVGQDVTKPFFGSHLLSQEQFFTDARGLLKRQLVPGDQGAVRCWGFKEIRYTPTNLRIDGRYDLAGYLTFLGRLLPSPAFIFLTRKHEDVVRSGFWAERDRREAVEQFRMFEESAKQWSTGRCDCFWIDYDSVANCADALVEMYNFLGVRVGLDAVKNVLNRKHSVKVRKEIEELKRNWRIDLLHSSGLKEFLLDESMPSELHSGVSFTLSGIALLDKSAELGCALAVRDRTGQKEVQWHLNSQKFAKKHPNNPYAKKARFRVDGLSIEPGGSVELLLRTPQGQFRSIAKIAFKEDDSARDDE